MLSTATSNQWSRTLARRPIRFATRISIITLASTPVVHARRWCIHLPVRHTVCFITFPPVAPLPHVALLLEHRLLRPDDMTLRIAPWARRSWRGAVAILVAKLKRDGHTNINGLFYINTDFSAHGRGARLTDLSAGEGGNHAVGCAGAVGVAGGFFPWLDPTREQESATILLQWNSSSRGFNGTFASNECTVGDSKAQYWKGKQPTKEIGLPQNNPASICGLWGTCMDVWHYRMWHSYPGCQSICHHRCRRCNHSCHRVWSGFGQERMALRLSLAGEKGWAQGRDIAWLLSQSIRLIEEDRGVQRKDVKELMRCGVNEKRENRVVFPMPDWNTD